MTMTLTQHHIDVAAQAAHEANRIWCLAHGDNSQFHWEEAEAWQRDSARQGVQGILAGNGPEESHANWLKHKTETGWVYGSVKDSEKKQHPCMVPYDKLPPAQKVKDHIFVATVRAFIEAFEATT